MDGYHQEGDTNTNKLFQILTGLISTLKSDNNHDDIAKEILKMFDWKPAANLGRRGITAIKH